MLLLLTIPLGEAPQNITAVPSAPSTGPETVFRQLAYSPCKAKVVTNYDRNEQRVVAIWYIVDNYC